MNNENVVENKNTPRAFLKRSGGIFYCYNAATQTIFALAGFGKAAVGYRLGRCFVVV